MELENATKKEKKTSKTKKSKKEISSEEETDEEEEYKIESESSDSEGTSDGSSETESEGEVIIKKKKETSNKRKRLATPEKTKGKKLKKDNTIVTQKKDEEREGGKMDNLKQKKEEEKEEKMKEEMMSKEGETNVTDSKINQPMPKETEKIYTQVVGGKTDKKTKKVAPSFDSGKVDFNLHTEDPTNINNRTVQISSGLKMQCKMMSGLQSFTTKINYPDWAALAFIKKIKDDKVFEFNVPLKDAPKIMEGIKLLIKENPRFFDS